MIVAENERIRDLSRPDRYLGTSYWDSPDQYAEYRPLTMAAYALNHALFGLAPASWHAINVALHALVCWLLWLFVRMLFGSEPLAAWTALFFSVHALHVEVVAGVVGRAELLAAAGTLAALIAGVACMRSTQRRGRILCAVACGLATALAIGSKEGGVAAPALLLMLPFAQGASPKREAPREAEVKVAVKPAGGGRARKRKRAGRASAPDAALPPALSSAASSEASASANSAPPGDRIAKLRAGLLPVVPALAASVVAVALYLLARLLVLGTLVQTEDTDLRYSYYNPLVTLGGLPLVLTRLKLVGLYFQLLVAPFAPSPDYSWNSVKMVHGLSNPQWMSGVLVLIAWAGIIFAGRRRAPVWFGMMFLTVSLAPTSNLVLRIGAMTAERWFYLPSAGLCLSAAWLVSARHDFSARVSRAVLACALVWATALAAQTVRYLPTWRDNPSVYARMLKRFPDNGHANRLNANALVREGDPAGLELLRRAVDIRLGLGVYPPLDDEFVHLFSEYMKQGRVAEREEILAVATTVLPDPGWFYTKAGDELSHHGEKELALEYYARGKALKPEAGMSSNHAGQVLLSLGRTEDALAMFREAAAVEPEDPDFAADLAGVLVSLGRDAEAATAYVTAVRLDPDNVELLNDAAATLASVGRPADALPYLERAVALDATNLNALINLGFVRLDLGDAARAREALERALRLDPSNELVLRTLGGIAPAR